MAELSLKHSWAFGAFVLFAGCSVTPKQIGAPRVPSSEVNKNFANSSCQHTETALNCVKVVEIYDGDTIFIDIAEAPPPFRKRLGVRIAGIDTPELASKDMCEKLKAQKAKSLLKSLIDNAERVDVVDVKKDKYFRILGTVLVDGQPVGEELIRRDLAYRYHGEGKVRRNWCDSN